MAITRTVISWIAVSDLKKAEDFFVHVLGLELHVKDEKIQWLELSGRGGGARLGVASKDNPYAHREVGTNAIMNFRVDNIEGAKQALEEKGVVFTTPILEAPGYVKIVRFVDPDGNEFQLEEDISKQ